MIDPRRGDIALCSKGHKGLITSEEPESMRFQNGIEQFVWKGIYIEDVNGHKIGDSWYSQDPKVIDRTLEGLRVLYEASFAVYNNDDAFTQHDTDEEYDAVTSRDDDLGMALDLAKKLLRR